MCMLNIHPMIFFSQLVSNIFSITLSIWLGFPHPLTLGYHITFMANLWTLWRSTFFVVPMVGRGWLPMMLCGMEGCKISSFIWTNSHSFVTCLSFFTSTNQHCDFNGWYLDVGIIIGDPTLTNLVLQIVLSYGVATTIVAELRMHYNKMHPCL
jgi:hypothetical protein